jgi:hypothetical protein
MKLATTYRWWVLYSKTRNWKRWRFIAETIHNAMEKADTTAGMADFRVLLNDLHWFEKCLKKCVLKRMAQYSKK